MKRTLIALLSILAFALVSPLATAGDRHGKDNHHGGDDHEHSDGCKSGSHHDDSQRGHDDDDHCSTVQIPVPTKSTPPTQTAATFLTILPAVPSATSINSSLGSVTQFYTAATWATVVSNRNSHGAILSEVQSSSYPQSNLLGVVGTFNIVNYTTRFADGSVMNETVAMQLGTDGVWRVAYYALETPGIADPLLAILG
ncbi:MAG: DUF4019 domain-containing protein [Betaproteobacteria bacterium]|nr:DUF4019 domain-containing protein [Betaproteobacteria bacterium]